MQPHLNEVGMDLDLDYIKQQFVGVHDTLNTIQESNAALYKKVTDLQIHLQKLEGAVVGNSELGYDGLVKRVKALEDFKDVTEKLKAKFVGATFVATTVAGLIWAVVIMFLDKII